MRRLGLDRVIVVRDDSGEVRVTLAEFIPGLNNVAPHAHGYDWPAPRSPR